MPDTSSPTQVVNTTLSGIPIEFLIASPLVASARANTALAAVLLEFLEAVAYGESTGSLGSPKSSPPQKGSSSAGVSGGTNLKNMMVFDLERPYQDDTGAYSTETVTVQAPLLALVPIPALLIQSVDVNLTITVDTSLSTTDQTKLSTPNRNVLSAAI